MRLEIFTVEGHVDAVRLSEYLDVDMDEVAQILGCSSEAVRERPATPEYHAGLEVIAGILEGLLRLTGGDRNQVLVWLKASHPALGDTSPLALMKTGEVEVVVDLVDDMLTGAPS